MYNWIGKMTTNQIAIKFLRRWNSRIPQSVCHWILNFFSVITFYLATSQKNHLLKNMRELLPEHSENKLRHYCRVYFYNLFLTIYEILIDSIRLHQSVNWRFRTTGEHHLQETLKQGKGVILLAPHMGNFFYYYWYLSRKYSCLTVVTAGSQELRPLYLIFQQLGCEGLDYDQTPPLVLMRKLRDHLNKNGVVLLLGDFWRPHFPKSTFFHKETRSPGGTAILALEKHAPVIPFYGYRHKGFQHQLVFGSPVWFHKCFQPDQRSEAIQLCNHMIEEMVNQVPGQWFYWFNVDERWEDSGKRRRCR